jgi:leucyl/phenylalanyl-tRNA--protein transferase
MAENATSHEINFFKPKKRFIIPIDNFHIPKKLFNEFKKKKYTYSINKNFSSVVNQCAKPRIKDSETWINKIIQETYNQLFINGFAKSIECFYENKLIAGLYGVHIGSCFFGESMFSNISNTSKFCLLLLISILKENNFKLLDSQFYNPHLLQFGAFEILDDEYQLILKKEINKKSNFPNYFDIQKSISVLQSISQRS